MKVQKEGRKSVETTPEKTVLEILSYKTVQDSPRRKTVPDKKKSQNCPHKTVLNCKLFPDKRLPAQ